jgi:hypothetical protein
VERLKQLDRAEKDLAKVRKMLGLVVTEIQSRLANERMIGKSGLPKLRLLTLPEDAQAKLGSLVTNEHVRSRVMELERLLGTRLRPAAAVAPQAHEKAGTANPHGAPTPSPGA